MTAERQAGSSCRELVARGGMSLRLLGLARPLADSRALATPLSDNRLAPRQPHCQGKAKRVVHLFMNGGPSHVDTFDPKPALDKYAGQELPVENLKTERKTGAALASPYKFAKHGQAGIEVSDIFPHVARQID